MFILTPFSDVKPRMWELLQLEVVTRTLGQWKELAFALHFKNYEVAPIIKMENLTMEYRCRDMLGKWLDGMVRAPRTWSTLLQALREIGQTEFAEELHLKLTGTKGAQLEGEKPEHRFIHGHR